MYKRILGAVDGSATAELALQESSKLAQDINAELRLDHIVDIVIGTHGRRGLSHLFLGSVAEGWCVLPRNRCY